MAIGIESAHTPTTCSLWTLGAAVDPIGSAGTYELFLCVEHPLPWPKDVSDIPEMRDAALFSPRVRALAVVPGTRSQPTASGEDSTVLITSWRRSATHAMVGRDHRVPAGAVQMALASLIRGDEGGWPSSDVAAEILVCGHGKRDRCCGNLGTRLEAAVADRTDPIRIRRCSHTGGHRFAPTGVSFPEGRMWANLTPEAVDQIAHRSGDPLSLHAHHRGCTGLDEWAQVAERALFEQLGWRWLTFDVSTAQVEVASDGRSATVGLDAHCASETLWVTASVAVRRKVPVPVCGEIPTDANKTSNEYELVSLAIGDRR